MIMEIEPEEYVDEFRILRLLGEGGQANVYLGSRDGLSFALKVYGAGPSKEAAYRVEAELLGRLKHPHLINMLEHRPQAKLKLRNRPEERRPLIVLELAEGGELFDYISKTGAFPPELARTYLQQLLSALTYLDSVGVTHRDLKPENILFDSHFNLKVSDFGLARNSRGDQGDGQLRSRVGTEGYRAPEVEAGCYEGLKVDLFAIGVILFIMYKGTPPFLRTRTHDRVYRLIRERRYAQFWQLHEKGREPGFYSDSFKRLINSFISAEPDRRPSLEALEQDEWMGGTILKQEELEAEMAQRAARMGKTFSKPNVEQMCSKEGYRSSIDLEDEATTKEEVFTHSYYNANIKTETLPVVTLPSPSTVLVPNANFLVAWVNSFLFQQKRDNVAFLEDFVEKVTLTNYTVEYQEPRAEVEVRVSFEVAGEDEVEVGLVGALQRTAKGTVGVEWRKVEGNSFWLSAIRTALNHSLNALL